ncbi:GNAT family N-acetyltransferase [Nocardioides kribbensis]|uniref:GNAT family N-acetyltransferase n=1 Tax=Nocardioides kribbensis TaxID=305517 RepID=A0ABV1P329_9ACTN
MSDVRASVAVRPRRPDDLPALVAVLAAQQPGSGYSMRWPLPFPAEEFVVRPGERAAWVAEREGRVVGHVSVTDVPPDLAEAFARPAPEPAPAMVAVLYVDPATQGTGTGGLLLDRAVAWIRDAGLRPVLDVAPSHPRALAVYRRRGWVEVGTARPAWLRADRPDLILMELPLRR